MVNGNYFKAHVSTVHLHGACRMFAMVAPRYTPIYLFKPLLQGLPKRGRHFRKQPCIIHAHCGNFIWEFPKLGGSNIDTKEAIISISQQKGPRIYGSYHLHMFLIAATQEQGVRSGSVLEAVLIFDPLPLHLPDPTVTEYLELEKTRLFRFGTLAR